MSILVTKANKVVVQGATGKSGRRAVKEMLSYGTTLLAGVTPGKGGERVEEVPVYNTVKEAVKAHNVDTSVLVIPPLFVKNAACEAIDAGIKLLVIITENVPVKDAAKIKAYADKHDARVIGPSSVGVITPDKAKLGLMGGSLQESVYTPGSIGIISKSGGMCSETARLLTNEGLGQSTVVGVGGDTIAGSTFADLLPLYEADDETKAIVLFGEIGGSYEELAAELVKERKITKPVVAFISGQFAEQLGHGLALGHAGAIIEDGKGSASEKKKALRDAGVIVADYHDDIPRLVKEALEKNE